MKRAVSQIALAFGLACLAFLPLRASDPPQGAAFLKTDILGVFAHPDDETGMAATLAHYAHGEKKVIAHSYVTRGEGGGNMVGTQAGSALGVLREAELRECLRILGVRYTYFLDQQDFFYTESLTASLRKWRKEEALEKLVRLVRTLRPELILTLNPAPNPGQHGHHQAAGVLATEAFTAAADPARFPSQIADEGLAPWQARKLFYGGASGSPVTTIETTRPLPDGRIPADIAGEALSQHRSQAFGGFLRSPWLRRPQSFTVIKSDVTPVPNATDLFDGLIAPRGGPPLTCAASVPDPILNFIPRPAIVRFRIWATEQQLAPLAAAFPADLPVLAGEPNELKLQSSGAIDFESLKFEAPPGWQIRSASRPRATRNPAPSELSVWVTPPADTLGDVEVRSWIADRPEVSTATARLHPVPTARVPRHRGLSVLDPAQPFPGNSALLTIGTNRVWQGSTSNPADSSAEVRLAHNRKEIFLDITVHDDHVVSNLQPDDIKGHWRTDSVEVCLDPDAGAEDTTGCFKLGIIPFDTTGQVRAARDADALQGPIERTAPGLRLASHRTPDGYRLQVAVPLSLVLGNRPLPRRLGFNVLIYDGDKPDAAPGENINECRLAWAPRSGVQGRPEDWGRIDLE